MEHLISVLIVGQGMIGKALQSQLLHHNYPGVDQPCSVRLISSSDFKLEGLDQFDAIILAGDSDTSSRIVDMIDDAKVDIVIIDMSPGFRTDPTWAYAFSLLDEQCTGNRFSMPGCFASGFLYSLLPLRRSRFWSHNIHLHLVGIGGKSVLGAAGADKWRSKLPIQFNLNKEHRHLPELRRTLTHDGITFSPIITEQESGIMCQVRVALRADAAMQLLKAAWGDTSHVDVVFGGEYDKLSPNAMSGKAGVVIYVHEDDDGCMLTTLMDNVIGGAVMPTHMLLKRAFNPPRGEVWFAK